MNYRKELTLKNGKTLLLRNCIEADARESQEVFEKTHGETDFLLTYPDENSFNLEGQVEYIKNKADSNNEVEIAAFVDGKMAGTAGVDAVGSKFKLQHRAEFGIGILKEYWGLGIGSQLTLACIECAKKVGYEELDLDVVADNDRALAMYKKLGFTEYGRNPKGFKSRLCGYQELVYMRLEL